MGDHIVNGKFQSDKYPSCPSGKVPLSIEDATAQDLLWEYAQRRRAVDAGFSEDLETCLRAAGFVPPQHAPIEHVRSQRAPIAHVKQALTAAFTVMAGVEYGETCFDEAPDTATEAAVYADRVTAQLHTDTEQGVTEK